MHCITLICLFYHSFSSVMLLISSYQTEISWMIGGYPVAGHLPVIRCIPTVACSIRAGVMVYSRGRYCNESDVKPFLNLFSLTGYCEEVPEKHIDAFTAFSGSGVAFVSESSLLDHFCFLLVSVVFHSDL